MSQHVLKLKGLLRTQAEGWTEVNHLVHHHIRLLSFSVLHTGAKWVTFRCHSGDPSKLNFQWGSCRWILRTPLFELSDRLPSKPIPAAGVIFWVTAATQRLCSPCHSWPALAPPPPRNTLLVATLRWQRQTRHNNYCSGDLKNAQGPWARWEELHQTDHIVHVENQDLKPYDQD